MAQMIRLSLLQVKFQVGNLGFLLLTFFILIGIFLPPYDYLSLKASSIFLNSTILVMLVLFSGILSQEFEYKTSKVLFTSGLTRMQIMSQKLMAIIGLCILLSLLYNLVMFGILLFENQEISFRDFYLSVFHFVTYGLCIGTFALLISTITFSSIFSFLITFVLYGGVLQSVILLVGEKHRNELVREMVQHTPFYIASGFKYFSYTLTDFSILIGTSLFTFVIACVILKKRDLR